LAEEKRRIPELVGALEKKIEKLRQRYAKEYGDLYDEWIRAIRAKPGSKYDIWTLKRKK